MKTLSGTLSAIVIAASAAFAKDDLGSFEDARSAWPESFVPGKVATIDLAGESLYAFAGEAESFFSGEMAESDAELYEEATLDAKARFYETMTERDPSRSVSLSGLRVAYRWSEGPMRRVVCVVPRRNVKVTPSGSVPNTSSAPPVSSEVVRAPLAFTNAPSLPVGGDSPKNQGDELCDPSDAEVVETAVGDETSVEAKIRVLRARLAETPDDPFLRLRLARLFAQSGQASRATRHYRDLVKRLALDRSAMTAHDAASTMVEAAEHARAIGNEAQALKFYRSARKLGDPDLQPRITAAISLLRLHVD